MVVVVFGPSLIFFNPPEGPKIKKFEISSEIVIFERATHRGPIFCGEIETVSRRDWNFRARSKFSIEIENFDRD